MRAFIRPEVTIEFVTDSAADNELLRVARKYGFQLTAANVKVNEGSVTSASTIRTNDDRWMHDVLPALVYLASITQGTSPNKVLEEIRRKIADNLADNLDVIPGKVLAPEV